MPEYIEREAAIKAIESQCVDGKMYGNDDCYTLIDPYDAIDEIGDLPAADVAPVVHGRWDGESDGFADGEPVIDVWYCSKCGHCLDEGIDDPYILPNFCPNCGAKMDLEESHETP